MLFKYSKIVAHFALEESLEESGKVPCMVGSIVEPSERVTGGHKVFCRFVKHCVSLLHQ